MFGVAVGATVMFVLNVMVYSRYIRESKTDQSLASVSKVPWILSIASCFVGPFGLILAPVALVMGYVEYFRAARVSENALRGSLPLLAICNSGVILFGALLFGSWTLFFAMGAFR